MYRTTALAAGLALVLLGAMLPSDAHAKQRGPVLEVRLIVSAAAMQDPPVRDAVFEALTNLIKNHFPYCTDLRASTMFNRRGSTVLVRVRCFRIDRNLWVPRHYRGDVARLGFFILSMPELPEVEITRRKLRPLLRGRRILDFWTDWPRGLRSAHRKSQIARDMRGREVFNITRRGKVLFFKLGGQPARVLAIHLRMSGRLEVAPVAKATKAAKAAKEPQWVHFVWWLSGDRQLRFVDPRKFGRVWYGASAELAADPYLGRLGADVRSLTPQRFLAVLSSGAGMVKPFLLRQDKFPGIGNIIADESLWRAQIYPETRITDLDPRVRRRLYQSIQHTIRAMLSSGGTSIRTWRHPDGTAGRYQERRRVYGKAGNPCPRCRTRLRRIVVGGRGTTVCPQCQRLWEGFES